MSQKNQLSSPADNNALFFVLNWLLNVILISITSMPIPLQKQNSQINQDSIQKWLECKKDPGKEPHLSSSPQCSLSIYTHTRVCVYLYTYMYT